MNQTVRKFISSTLSVSTAFGFSALGIGAVHAAQLQHIQAVPADPTVFTTTNFVIGYVAQSSTAVKLIKIQFATDPSSTSVTVPGTGGSHVLTTTSAALASYVAAGTITSSGDISATPGTAGSFVVGNTTNGLLTLDNSSGQSVSSGQTQVLKLTTITNNDLYSHCDQQSSSATTDTCYIRINTYSDEAGNLPLDSGVASYTVMTPVTATATVDPTLTFTVSGVDGTNLAGAVTTNDPNWTSGVTTGMAGVITTPTTIPFGNVKVNQVRVAQQRLAVITNANNGYNTYSKFIGNVINTTPGVGGTNLMGGTQGTNKLDAFTGTSGGSAGTTGSITWNAPGLFVAPISTVSNTNSGWVGERTSNYTANGGVGNGNFSTAGVYGPPAVGTGAGIGNAVMVSAGPDNGLTPTAVTYKIAADAYQPADLYTGTVVYTVVASY